MKVVGEQELREYRAGGLGKTKKSVSGVALRDASKKVRRDRVINLMYTQRSDGI